MESDYKFLILLHGNFNFFFCNFFLKLNEKLNDTSGAVSTDIERKNYISTPDEVILKKKKDSNNDLEPSSIQIKCEEEEKNDDLTESLDIAEDNSFEDLSATVVLETKIEIDEFSEDIKSFELENLR